MKLLLVIVVLGAGVWFLMMKAKENAAVKQMTQAPEKYTSALQSDVARAKAAEETATKLIKSQEQQVKTATDAAQ
jgi:hypothetical protein